MKITSLLSQNELNAVIAFKRKIINKYPVNNFKLYGSKARGDSDPESDIDIMIELEDDNSKIESEIDDMVFDINVEYDVFISVLFFSKKSIIDGPMSESPIYKVIQKEGISL